MTEEEADHKQAITTEEKDMAARKEEKTATRLALRAVDFKKRNAEEAHHTADRYGGQHKQQQQQPQH